MAAPGAWRETLLQRLLVTLTPIIVAAVIMGIIGSHGSNRFLFATLIGPLVVVQVCAALSKQWPYRLRATILIAPLLVATVLVYFLLGFRGNASVVGACAVVLTGLLFGRREMVLLLIVMAVAAAEVAVGLAIVISLFRTRRTIDTHDLQSMSG